MRVTFYGVRGSCPAPGPDTAQHGGNTSCIAARLDDDTLLIFDAGTGIRILGKELIEEGYKRPLHLLLSHTHWDHIIGLPFFDPIWVPDTRLFIHPLTNNRQERFRWRPTIFDEIHFPVPARDIPCKVELADHPRSQWTLGSATILRIRLNHPGGAQGFRIEDRTGSVFCFITDNELSPPGKVTTSVEQLAQFVEGADVLVHDAQFLEEDMPHRHGWGHSLVDDVLRFGEAAKPKKLVLFHHDPDRNDDALVEIGHRANRYYQERGLDIPVVMAHEGLVLDLK
jgi:phosphoribosyl 1,2-cyclic phosphodiesterase